MMTRALNSKYSNINESYRIFSTSHFLQSTNRPAKEFSEIPGPKSYPLVGNLFSLKKYGGHLNQTLPNLLFDLQKTYGNVVKFGISKKPEIYVFDPINIEKVFTLNDKDPEKRKFDPWIIYFDELKKAQSLSNSDGQRWRKLRSSINPVLARPQAVAKHIGSQVKIVGELVDVIRAKMDGNKSSTVEFEHFEKTLRFLSLELISNVILNRKIIAVDDRFRTQETEKFAFSITVFAKTMSDLMSSSTPLWKFVSTRKWREFKRTCDEFFNFINSYIKEALDKDSTTQDNHSVIKYLDDNKTKYDLTDDDVSSVAAELFLGGIETMSTSLHFAIYQLAVDKKFQDGIYSEIVEYIKPGKQIEEESLGKFKYLKAYLKEVFRYFPIISVYGRVAKEDMILNGYKIPRGTFLNVVPVVTSKLENVFDRPNEFDPNRWLDKTKEYHPFAFLPFGHGSRNCVARRISEQEIYIILLKIIENFQIDYVGEKVKFTDSTFIQPDKPLHIKFTKRQQ